MEDGRMSLLVGQSGTNQKADNRVWKTTEAFTRSKGITKKL